MIKASKATFKEVSYLITGYMVFFKDYPRLRQHTVKSPCVYYAY